MTSLSKRMTYWPNKIHLQDLNETKARHRSVCKAEYHAQTASFSLDSAFWQHTIHSLGEILHWKRNDPFPCKERGIFNRCMTVCIASRYPHVILDSLKRFVFLPRVRHLSNTMNKTVLKHVSSKYFCDILPGFTFLVFLLGRQRVTRPLKVVGA